MRKIQFYFDYLSPFAYIAWTRLRRLEDQGLIEIEYRPVLFAALLNHWGQLGPAEIPPKRDYVLKQCFRTAKLNNIALTGVKFHPFNPLVALRVSTFAVAGAKQLDVIKTLWKMGWEQGGDPSSVQEITQALRDVGLDGSALIAKTSSEEVKEELKTATQKAIDLGVFGVPTMIVDGELFWGNDSIEHMLLFIESKDPLNREQIAQVLSRPAQAVRPRH